MFNLTTPVRLGVYTNTRIFTNSSCLTLSNFLCVAFLFLQLPTKRELVELIAENDMEGVDSRKLKLTKRRLTKEKIKENNMTGGI